MPQFEKTLVDRFIQGAFMGKREIGRPIKYNIRTQDTQGWIELVFNPRSPVEQYLSQAIKFANPYIFAMTYKFHVEKAREAGKYLSVSRGGQLETQLTPLKVTKTSDVAALSLSSQRSTD